MSIFVKKFADMVGKQDVNYNSKCNNFFQMYYFFYTLVMYEIEKVKK